MPKKEETEKAPKPKPKATELPDVVDVVYRGSSPISHYSTDPEARDGEDYPVKYVFNPGVPVRVQVPYDIAKFCHLAWVSNPSHWEVLEAGTDRPVEALEKIPYPPHPAEPAPAKR